MNFLLTVVSPLMDLKENNPEQYDEIVNEFESQEFNDFVDFVLWIES